MPLRPCLLPIAALTAAVTLPLCAQVTRADIEKALVLNKTYRTAAGLLPGDPHWIEHTHRLWVELSDGTVHDYRLFNADSGQGSPLDKAKIFAALGDSRPRDTTPATLVLRELTFDRDITGFRFDLPDTHWHCTFPGYDCHADPHGHPQPNGDGEDPGPRFEGNDAHRLLPSPDGRWEASIQNFNVFVHQKGSADAAFQLGQDGNAGDYYQFSSLRWSPDSHRLLAVRTREGMHRMVHYVQSSPEDQLQPIASERFYAKPGDVLDHLQPVLFDPAARTQRLIAEDEFPNPYELSEFAWRANSSAFTFVYNQRGHQRLSVLSVDSATGDVRRVVDETSKTFIEYTPLNPEPQGTGKFYRHDMADGNEILWLSERDGWAHLYLYNGATGQVKNQVTHGNWVVRGVEYVDEPRREIYFDASGVDPQLDPYFTQLYRIRFDGTGMERVSNAVPANHIATFSDDGAFYTDAWSRVDLAPVLELHRTEGNSKVATLATADLSALKAAGWRPPEVFTAKGRDGFTDIWGLLYKPAHFDPSQHYPVIEDIYAGPQGSFVPKSFTPRTQLLTQLGFVVVQIDGMGTNNRSKAFHDIAWKNLKDAGFQDRILWHKAVAQRFPWYDIERVGIFGTSAGGQSAMGALLFHPEFYKAAVSNSGCHDNRMDKIWWNEQWMGWPIGPQYEDSSNVVNAWRLQGRLMLVMGEMDTNVDPSSTLQVVNALIKANKDFDLLDVPNGGHGAGGTYGQRRLMEFFLRSLQVPDPLNFNATPPSTSNGSSSARP